VAQALATALVVRAPSDHRPSAAEVRRRRVVVAITLLVGGVLLGFSLATPPGQGRFATLTAAVAGVWVLGAVASGPLHLGSIPFRGRLRRPFLTPVVLGLAAGAVFVAGALIIRDIEPLRSPVARVLEHARRDGAPLIALVTLANGIAEELFFRGAVFAAVGWRHPAPASTVIYVVVTAATGNPMLVLAGAVMGLLFALQRRASGGVLAPMLTHVTWSMIMLAALPPIIGR
jgi:membrane protease YdiL (CAAX protease family)